LLQRLFNLGLLALQQLKRIGSVRGHVRRHLSVAVDVEAHIDAPELRRIEPNVKLIGAGLRPGGDRDGEPATGTAAAVEAVLDDAKPVTADGVATAKAEKPRFDRPPASVFAPAAPFCVFDVPSASDEEALERSAARALAWSELTGADASVWADASGAVSVACV
jgi:hypothetical protein